MDTSLFPNQQHLSFRGPAPSRKVVKKLTGKTGCIDSWIFKWEIHTPKWQFNEDNMKINHKQFSSGFSQTEPGVYGKKFAKIGSLECQVSSNLPLIRWDMEPDTLREIREICDFSRQPWSHGTESEINTQWNKQIEPQIWAFPKMEDTRNMQRISTNFRSLILVLLVWRTILVGRTCFPSGELT